MTKESTISVFVKEMRVNVRIGLEDFERKAPQALVVNVELFTDVAYLKDARPETIIDYARIYEVVKGWENRGHVELIETYLQELLDLGFGFERVTACRACVSKPDIFEEAGGAGLSVYVRREDWRKA